MKSKSATIEDWRGTGEVFDGGGKTPNNISEAIINPIQKDNADVYKIVYITNIK